MFAEPCHTGAKPRWLAGRRPRLVRAFACLVLLAVLEGCGMSTSEISETVKTSMQQTLATSPQFRKYGLTVQKVDVIKGPDHQHKAIASIMHEGERHDVPITINENEGKVLWEAPPGSFAFLAETMMRDAMKDAANSMGDLMASVARDAVNQYRIAQREGDPIQTCVQAGLVSAAYLQAQDEPNYVHWKDVQRTDCARAGMPLR